MSLFIEVWADFTSWLRQCLIPKTFPVDPGREMFHFFKVPDSGKKSVMYK